MEFFFSGNVEGSYFAAFILHFFVCELTLFVFGIGELQVLLILMIRRLQGLHGRICGRRSGDDLVFGFIFPGLKAKGGAFDHFIER